MKNKEESQINDYNIHDEKPSSILVIGDLFIDENWLMAKSDNYHSTNVGEQHFISMLQGPKGTIISLCGIANVLKILGANPRDYKNPLHKYDFIGASAWNPKDTQILKCFICREGSMEEVNPYTLTGLKIPQNDGESVICPYTRKNNNCDCELNLMNLIPDHNADKSSTNRLFRIYEGFGSDQPKLLNRFDWGIEINEEELAVSKLDKIKDDVKAVIIVDHGKGVIKPAVVKKLMEKFPNTDWYVRLKLAKPEWLLQLREMNKTLRLIVMDQQLVNHQYGIRIWKHGSRLGRGALEVLSDLLGLRSYEHGDPTEPVFPKTENAAVLFEDDSAIAGSRIDDTDDANLFYVPRPSPDKKPIQVGRTSIFFNSLIYWDLNPSREKLAPASLFGAVDYALQNMYKWTEECTDAWMVQEPSKLRGPFNGIISWEYNNINLGRNSMSQKHSDSWREWNASSQGLGIVKYDDYNKELHLWRTFGTIPNYVCPGGIKRSKINNLVNSMSHYIKLKSPSFPFNCLFLAEPGWGKSYLANCLAKHFDFEFLEFSLAQMSCTQDFIDCFKVIVSVQKRSNKRVLVFMDEVDAEIEGHTALGLLLGPMWDGIFKIEGNTNKIDPCIWIFASTKPVDTIKKKYDKGRDFLSRINGPTIDLDFLTENERKSIHEKNRSEEDRENALEREAKKNKPLGTEIIYHVINLLNKMYGPITHVEEDVLRSLYQIWPKNGIRSLSIYASRFRGITKGMVTKENTPSKIAIRGDSELLRHIDFVDRDLEEKTKNVSQGTTRSWIRILFNPPTGP